MTARYGLDRRPIGTIIGATILIAAFVAALIFVSLGLNRDKLTSTLITWDDVAPDHVSVTFDVQRQAADTVTCVVRAQDKSRADVGYAPITIEPGAATVRVVYELRTLAPAYVLELLGCSIGPTANVIQPQFPPGVVPPDQPWSP
jgi:Domain of unknown function (DUF4307)